MSEQSDQIVAFVREHPGSTSKEVRIGLGIGGLRKKDVNKTLYAAKAQGLVESDVNPDGTLAPIWGPVAELVA